MTKMQIIDPGLPEDSLDKELVRLARALGHLPPFTDQEIERAGRRLDKVGLPSCLSSLLSLAPDPFTMEWKPLRAVRTQDPTTEDVAELLARAARDGGAITPEVEQRMLTDRVCAERDQEDRGGDH